MFFLTAKSCMKTKQFRYLLIIIHYSISATITGSISRLQPAVIPPALFDIKPIDLPTNKDYN